MRLQYFLAGTLCLVGGLPALAGGGSLTPCTGGFAGIYPCDNVDLYAHLTNADFSTAESLDHWGWVDPLDDKEYALVGVSDGTTFVDITDPLNPIYLGKLPAHVGTSLWRDVKVYANHAFIVSETNDHGMQVFDLTNLRSVVSPPVTFTETAHYDGFGRAHNIVINEDSGYAYAVGSTQGTTTCSSGLHMIDISTPTSPSFAGCFSSDGYTHDAQVILYNGPDTTHQGKEIAFAYNEDTLTIVDVTNKGAPAQLSRTGYTGVAYTHQGWIMPSHDYLLLDDEIDEQNFGHNTRTYIWDVRDLDNPSLIDTYTSTSGAIDHNQYIARGFSWQSNYNAGLRILSVADIANGNLSEAGYFDVRPNSDSASFNGAWSAYPYFPSGTVTVSTIEDGLFILKPNVCAPPDAPGNLTALPNGDNRIDLSWDAVSGAGISYQLFRSTNGCANPDDFEEIAAGITGTSYSDTTVSGAIAYAYRVRALDGSGLCVSADSNCQGASTSGPCTAPPEFDGLEDATNPSATPSLIQLDWSAGTALCTGPVTYSVYRSVNPEFDPAPGNRIASGATGTQYFDSGVSLNVTYFYIVRAKDEGTGNEDANTVRLSALATGPLVDGTFAAGAEFGDPVLLPSTGAKHIGWEVIDTDSNTGDRCWYSTYGDLQCTGIRTPDLRLTDGESSVLTFFTHYDIEPSYDGGVLEITTDGGDTWTPLTPQTAYPGSFIDNSNSCGFPSTQGCYTGELADWSQRGADLSAYAGETVQIRWQFSTDGGLTEDGWYLDDVMVTHVQVPDESSEGEGEGEGAIDGESDLIIYEFPLSDDQNVPNPQSGHSGCATAIFNPNTAELSVHVEHNVDDPANTHIHEGAPGVNGDVRYIFTSSTSPIDETFTLLPDDITRLLAGNLYVKIHSDSFPTGDVRGQIVQSACPAEGEGEGEGEAASDEGEGEGEGEAASDEGEGEGEGEVVDWLPDLFFDADTLNGNAVDTTEIPGRYLLRFDTSLPNTGLGEFRLIATGIDSGDGRETVNQRVQRSDGSTYVRDAGEFLYNPANKHMETQGWTSYRIREILPGDGVGAILAEGSKDSVRITSSTVYDGNLPNSPPQGQQLFGNGPVQGISVGYTDLYPRFLELQWVDFTGLPAGEYWLEAVVDPADHILESDETNNAGRVKVILPQGGPIEGEGEGEGEGSPEGEGEAAGGDEGEGNGATEGSPEGEGEAAGNEEGEGANGDEGEGEAAGGDEGEGEGNAVEAEAEATHTADQNGDNDISLSELLRVIQFFNSGGFSCAIPAESTEDGYQPGAGDTGCAPHASDYAPQDWMISLSELLRLIQFFNSGGYFACPDVEPATEDGFCPGMAP